MRLWRHQRRVHSAIHTPSECLNSKNGKTLKCTDGDIFCLYSEALFIDESSGTIFFQLYCGNSSKNNFNSLRNLKVRITNYINLYNTIFGHSFNWKYNDVPQPKKIERSFTPNQLKLEERRSRLETI